MDEEPLNAEYDLLDPEVIEELIALLETIDAPLWQEFSDAT